MTRPELITFLEENESIDCIIEDDFAYFRNNDYVCSFAMCK